MSYAPRVFIVVGSPGSGKDLIIKAVNDLGGHHAMIVPKHTSRSRRLDDGNEMICSDDSNYDISSCDVVYNNFGDQYGIDTSLIWSGLRKKIFQVLVVSNINAINELKNIFGDLLVLIYVHSEKNADDYISQFLNSNDEYIKSRAKKYRDAFNMFLKNYLYFKHVLIYAGSPEDLFDQIFRLFHHYETLGDN